MHWFLLVLLLPLPARAAFELDEVEASLPFAPHRELGGNPARLAAVSCAHWTLAHYLPFGLAALSRHSLGLALPLGRAGLSLGASSAGFALHRETTLRLDVGLRARPLALGAGLSALQLEQQGAPPRRALRARLGVVLRVDAKRELGVWGELGGGRLAGRRLFLRLGFRPDAHSRVYAHLRRRARSPQRLDLAAERFLHPRLRLRLGTHSAPRRFALGLEARIGRWSAEYALYTHARLGSSHAFVAGRACRGFP